jgi:hypothetical protein
MSGSEETSAVSSTVLNRVFIELLLLAPALHPQDASTGAIRGVVLDPDARPAPAAAIAVINTATGSPRSAVTDADGRFAVELLPPGDYSARAEIKGMSPCRPTRAFTRTLTTISTSVRES